MQTHAWNDYQLHSTYINWQVRSEKQNIKIKTNRKKEGGANNSQITQEKPMMTGSVLPAVLFCIIIKISPSNLMHLEVWTKYLIKSFETWLHLWVTNPLVMFFPYVLFINYVFLRPGKIKLFVRIMWAKKSRSVYFSLCFLSC